MLKSILYCLILSIASGWGHLFGQQPTLVLPIAHTNDASVVFNKSGDLLLSHSTDRSLVWSVKHGKLLFDLQLNSSKILKVSFNDDGDKIIVVSDKKGICIINAHSGKQEDCLSVDNNYMTDALFLQSQRQLITCHKDSSIMLWDMSTLKTVWHTKLPFVVTQLKVNANENYLTIQAEMYDPNNPDLTTITADFSLESKKIEDLVTSTMPGKTTVLSSNKFALVLDDGYALLTDRKSGKVIQKFKHDPFFGDLAFSASENVAAIIEDSSIVIWDIRTGQVIQNRFVTYFPRIEFVQGNKKLFIYSYFEDSCLIYDYVTGKTLLSFKAKRDKAHSQDYSKSQNRLAYASGSTITIIDTKKWSILFTLTGHTSSVQAINYNPGRHSLLSVENYKNIKQWNLYNGAIDVNIVDPTWCASIYGAYYCNDNTHILVDACEDLKTLWDAKTGKQYGDSILHSIDCVASGDSTIKARSYARSYLDSIRIYDGLSDSILTSIHTPIAEVVDVALSPDGKFLISIDKNNNVFLWDVAKKENIRSLYENPFMYEYAGDRKYNGVLFNKAGSSFVIETSENYLDLWSMENLSIVNQFPGSKAVFTNDSTIAGINHSVISFYDIYKNQEKYRLISIGTGKDYMILLSNGYYAASMEAIKLLYYVKNQKIISFEQLDVKYNRPDKVLEALGNTDIALIMSYRKAWEKRVKKLGIDTTGFRDDFSVPDSDFKNREAIGRDQIIKTLTLQINANDSTYQLERLNIWVNETPVFGQRGTIIRGNRKAIDTTITINLSAGENRIESSVTNVNGTESYRMPLLVNLSTPAKSVTRFIGIGIEKFSDGRYDLQYSVKDIRDLSGKMKERYGNDLIIDTLFNENVTVKNITALKKGLLKSSENDKVIIAYSGHGLLSKDYDYYLSTYAVNFDKPEENGLPYDELENLLDSIPARKKLLLIDACHSGEVDKDDLVTINDSSTDLIKGLKPVAYKKEGQLGLKNSFELMQSLFVNVGKSTGATVISAAAGTQFALERNDLKNGVFTYSILEAMNKYPTMKISELKRIVGERVEQLTKGLQKPTSRNETIAVDWEVW